MGRKLYDYDVLILTRKFRVRAHNATSAKRKAAREYNVFLIHERPMSFLMDRAYAKRVKT